MSPCIFFEFVPAMAARGSRGWGRSAAPEHPSQAVSQASSGVHAQAADFLSDLGQVLASRASIVPENNGVVPAAEWSSVSDSLSEAGDSFRREFGEWRGEQQRERDTEQPSLTVENLHRPLETAPFPGTQRTLRSGHYAC